MMLNVQARIETQKIVAVIRASGDTDIVPGMVALAEGGVRLLEITFTVPNAADAIRTTKTALGNRALVGAGTVTTVDQARTAIEAGAEYLVSPGLAPDVIAYGLSQKVLVIPGAFTPSEVMAAHNAGATLIKLFPAEPLGPGFLKSLLGPFPNTKFVVTGGIDFSNAATYLAAGAVAVGVGGSLVDAQALRNKDTAKLTFLAKQFVNAVHPKGVPAWSM